MVGIVDWARDLLVSRGALVEAEDGGDLRALLPAELAGALESAEWLATGEQIGVVKAGDEIPIEFIIVAQGKIKTVSTSNTRKMIAKR